MIKIDSNLMSIGLFFKVTSVMRPPTSAAIPQHITTTISFIENDSFV